MEKLCARINLLYRVVSHDAAEATTTWANAPQRVICAIAGQRYPHHPAQSAHHAARKEVVSLQVAKHNHSGGARPCTRRTSPSESLAPLAPSALFIAPI